MIEDDDSENIFKNRIKCRQEFQKQQNNLKRHCSNLMKKKKVFVQNHISTLITKHLLNRIETTFSDRWDTYNINEYNRSLCKFIKNLGQKIIKQDDDLNINNLCLLSSYQIERTKLIKCIVGTLGKDIGMADICMVDCCSSGSFDNMINQWNNFKNCNTTFINTYPSHAKGCAVPVEIEKVFVVIVNNLGVSTPYQQTSPLNMHGSSSYQRKMVAEIVKVFDPSKFDNKTYSNRVLLILSLNDSDYNISKTISSNKFSNLTVQRRLKNRYSFIGSDMYIPLPICSEEYIKEAICKTMLNTFLTRHGNLKFEIHNIISDPSTWSFDSASPKSNIDCLLQEVEYVTNNITPLETFYDGETILIHGIEDGSMRMSRIDDNSVVSPIDETSSEVAKGRVQQYITAILSSHFKKANFIMNKTQQNDLGQSLGFLSQQQDEFTPEIIVDSFTSYMKKNVSNNNNDNNNNNNNNYHNNNNNNYNNHNNNNNNNNTNNNHVNMDIVECTDKQHQSSDNVGNVIVGYNKRSDVVDMRTEGGELFFRSSLMGKMKIIMKFIHNKIKHEVRLAEERIEERLEAKIHRFIKTKNHKPNVLCKRILSQSHKKRRNTGLQNVRSFNKKLKLNRQSKSLKSIRLECDYKKNGQIRGRWRINYIDENGNKRVKRMKIDTPFEKVSEITIQQYGFKQSDIELSKLKIDFLKVRQIQTRTFPNKK
jgi:hypothetical protein